jgi:putative transposase
MFISHKIQLDPTVKQAIYFAQAAGTSRMVWNWALLEWERQYKEGGKPSGMKLKKEFNAVKYTLFPWLEGIHRDAHAAPFAHLQKSFQRFFKKTSRRPKPKVKGRCKDSFGVANDSFRVKDNRVRLPIIGWVRLTEPLRFSGKIMSATVSRTADKWFISIQVDAGDYTKPRTSNGTVGIDLGVKTLATCSDGQVFDSPKPLARFLSKIRHIRRRLSRKKKGSSRYQKLKTMIARLHARIRNIRQDCLHKVTTTLCRENQTVVVEDLCVKGMLKNRKLSRAISDVGMYEFRRQLEYKALIYGTRVVVADRFYPSSKTCSNCQAVKDVLSLAERTYNCASCGFEIDRDLNAARNLCTLGLRGIYARGPKGSGSCRKTSTKPCRVETRTKTRRREVDAN